MRNIYIFSLYKSTQENDRSNTIYSIKQPTFSAKSNIAVWHPAGWKISVIKNDYTIGAISPYFYRLVERLRFKKIFIVCFRVSIKKTGRCAFCRN